MCVWLAYWRTGVLVYWRTVRLAFGARPAQTRQIDGPRLRRTLWLRCDGHFGRRDGQPWTVPTRLTLDSDRFPRSPTGRVGRIGTLIILH